MPVPSPKTQDLADVCFRLMLVGIVAAPGEDREFPIREVAVERNPLLHIEYGTPVRIEHQGRAAHGRQLRSQVKDLCPVGPAASAKLVEEALGIVLSVPGEELFLEVRLQSLKVFLEFGRIEVLHRDRAMGLGA